MVADNDESNAPPDPQDITRQNLMERYKKLPARCLLLIAKAREWSGQIADDEQAAACSDLVAQFSALIFELESKRVMEGVFFLEGKRIVDGFFMRMLGHPEEGPNRNGTTLREVCAWLRDDVLAEYLAKRDQLRDPNESQLTRIRGDRGSLAAFRPKPEIKMVDRASLNLEYIREDLDDDAINRALKKWLKRNPNAKRGYDAYPGAHIWDSHKARVTRR